MALNIKSDRQIQILQLASAGLTDKEIALETGLAVGTLRTYWDRLRSRYQCRNRAELIATVLRRHAVHDFTAELLDELPMFVWRTDRLGRLEYCNGWFGKHPALASDIAGLERYMVEEDCVRYRSDTEAAWRAEKPYRAVIRLRPGPGLDADYMICLQPVADASGIISYGLGFGRPLDDDADLHVLRCLTGLMANKNG